MYPQQPYGAGYPQPYAAQPSQPYPPQPPYGQPPVQPYPSAYPLQQPPYPPQPTYPEQGQPYPPQPTYPQQPPYPPQPTYAEQTPYPPQPTYLEQGQPYAQQPGYAPQPFPSPSQPYPPQPQLSQPYPPQPQPFLSQRIPPPPPSQAYPPQPYASQPQPSAAYGGSAQALPGMVQGPPLTKFFVDLRKRAYRDYIIIMDMSGSMRGRKWGQAEAACMKIAPFACQADQDGVTLYLFNHRFQRFDNVRTAGAVQQIFMRAEPAGSTALHAVLHAAFEEHFISRKPTTVLVITDGAPDSKTSVEREIIQTTHRMATDEELSVSFIQIGDDRGATTFLRQLDDSLRSRGARFDIVDALNADQAANMTFDQLIHKSIYD